MKSLDFLKEGIAEDAHEMHLDHEVQMARQELYHAAEDAIALHKLLRHVSEQQGLEGWVSAKITLAADYLNTVREHLEYQLMSGGPAEGVTSVVGDSMPIAEGHADQPKKIFKKNGKPVGEVGIDGESSPGVGQWYMKCYSYGIDNSGYDSYEEAVAELKHCLKQGVAEGTGKNVVKSVKVGNFRHDLVDTGMG